MHTPVLLSETLDLLAPERGGIFVDATLGLGGHSEAILEREKKVRLIGIDQDEEALVLAKDRLGERIEYVRSNFANIGQILSALEIPAVDGILMDIGVSSMQLDQPERGFSFQADGPLDMRMDQNGSITAASIVNTWPEPKLADLFFRYGEERFARKIARFIAEDRQKKRYLTTKELSEMIVRAYPPALRYKRPHPATRVFQALRIEVNDELGVLEEGIAAGLKALAPGGRLAIITFHSLEDRIVKQAFRAAVEEGEFVLLNKKPIIASDTEQEENPRSRSAKLRGIERID